MKKIGLTSSKSARVFKPKDAKGGCEIDTSKTALVLIEYQSLRSAANFRRARSRLGSRMTGATEGTFGMFSSPMTGEEFLKKINA